MTPTVRNLALLQITHDAEREFARHLHAQKPLSPPLWAQLGSWMVTLMTLTAVFVISYSVVHFCRSLAEGLGR